MAAEPEMVPVVPEGEGNTSPPPRVSPSIKWCFTLHNWTHEDLVAFNRFQGSRYMIIGEEHGSEGETPHLQGYIEFKKKVRPFGIFPNGTIHWEKAKGTRAQNAKYCSKEGSVWVNGKRLRLPSIITDLRPWQRMVAAIVAAQEPDPRAIHWLWEPTGNFGKTAMAKWLVYHHDAIVVSGKAIDMKHAIITYNEGTGTYPDVLVLDIPRSVDLQYFSYTGMEELKNGLFHSSKYQGGMVLMATPHVIVFANRPPDMAELSADRWNVVRLDEWVPEE